MGELVVAWRTGERYRLVNAEQRRRDSRQALALLGAVAAVLLVCVGMALWSFDPAKPPERPGELAANVESQPNQSVANGRTVTEQPQEPIAAPKQLGIPDEDPHAIARVKSDPSDSEPLAKTKTGPSGQESASARNDQREIPFLAKNAAGSLNKRSEKALLEQLLTSVPELTLEEAGAPTPKDAKAAHQQIQKQIGKIAEMIKADPDAFVKHLAEKRPDLAGLNWRRGKDCQLENQQTEALQKSSRAIRAALDPNFTLSRSRSSTPKAPKIAEDDCEVVEEFWRNLHQAAMAIKLYEPEVHTLHQLLMTENGIHRLALVDRMTATWNTDAVVILAQRAVFDTDPAVRNLAVAGLSKREAKVYLPILLAAFRHPWPPAAEHAAEALVALKTMDALPQLADLLSQPDPSKPVIQSVDGKRIPMVRELVRVNHFRNCLLCHAPSTSEKDVVAAPIPTPGAPIPTSAAVYYGSSLDSIPRSKDANMVRADITYLKQDFSVMQPVKDHGVWPAQQRFDYLVRTRPLTAAENAALKRQRRSGKEQPLSEHKQAILYALRELTGQDAGMSAEEWRKVVSAMKKG